MKHKSRILAAVVLIAICLVSFGSRAEAAGVLISDMYERATNFPDGDLTRLASVLRKAEAGEEITLGFIGGSITEGANASCRENTYVSLVCKWWHDTFPNTAINVVNAGVGGTSSYLGVHRVEKDLLVYSPDLVFVEFAVNDTYSAFGMNSYENLVRRILIAPSTPAVILLFSVNQAGDSAQAVEAAIGEYYKLPMISYGNAVMPDVDTSNIQWKGISSDIVHPNDTGHSIYAALICAYIEEVYANLDNIAQVSDWTLPKPITPQMYNDAHIENCYTIAPVEMKGFGIGNINKYFTGNWSACADNASITYSVNASAIGIIYQRSEYGNFGLYDVYIDGKYVITLDGNYIEGQGTGTDVAALYFSADMSKSGHIVKIVKNPKSKNAAFVIAGLLVS